MSPEPPTIAPSGQPSDQTVIDGQAATFTVNASGTAPLEYQWQRNGIPITNATGATYTTPATTMADDGATYAVIVRNSAGTATSRSAVLHVTARPPAITTQPASLTVSEGQGVAFSVVATGTPPLSYQWRRNGSDIPGETSASYALGAATLADDLAQFTVVVSNAAGTVTSSTATLSVLPLPPVIVTEPLDATVNEGQAATFTVVATSSLPVAYRWTRNGVDVPGATSASYITPATVAADDGAVFQAVASSAGGATPINLAVLHVRAAPRITSQPQPATVQEGASATFSVVATGFAPLSYQWRKGGLDIPGATNASYTTPATVLADSGTVFSVAVSNVAGNVVSGGAPLSVTPRPPVITANPVPAIVNEGQSATFTVTATSSVPVTYQWSRNGQDIAGAIGSAYTTGPTVAADDGSVFRVMVSNTGGATPSSGATLSVRAAPRITTPPRSLTVTQGQTATFSVVATGFAPLSYQWRKGGVDIPGATNASYTTPATVLGDAGSAFSVTVSNSVGSVTSADAVLTVIDVNHPPSPTAPSIDMFELSSATARISHGDPDLGQSHTFAITTPPAHGSATVDAAGLVTYTPTVGFTGGPGADSLTVTVTDDATPPLSGTVTISVEYVRRAVVLTLVANPDPVAPYNNVTGANGLVGYELSIANVGVVPLASVSLTDTTPNASTALLASSSGAPTCGGPQSCAAGTTVAWPAFGLLPGEVRRFRLVTQVNAGTAAGTTLHDAAAVAYAGGALTASRDIIASAAAGLRLGLEEDRDPVAPGGSLTYTLVLANTAAQGQPASGQGVLTATIPPGTTFASASPGGTVVGGAVQWSFASVGPGAAQRFSYTVTVGNAVPDGTVLEASAQALDGASSLVRAGAATEVRAAVPLAFTVTANPDPVAPYNNVTGANGLMTYEYRVSNLGSATVSNIVVSHLGRNDATALLASSTGGPTCGAPLTCGPGTVVTWPSFSLAAGQTQTFRLLAQVVGTVGINGFVHSTAAVTSSAGQLIRGADLVGSAAAGLRLGLEEDRDPVAPGGSLTYTLVLANTAAQGQPASGQGVLTATIPPGTTFASASPGGTVVGGAVQWSFASVGPGAAQRFSYTVTVGNAVPDGTVLEASAQALDGASSLVRAGAATEVRALLVVQVTLAAAPDPVANLGIVTYTATVTNLGATPLTNVEFAAQMTGRANVILSTSTPGGSCGGPGICAPGQFVTWPVFNLASGQSQTFTYTAQIVGATPGIIVESSAFAVVNGGIVRQGGDIVVN